jgi:hypothetical protein
VIEAEMDRVYVVKSYSDSEGWQVRRVHRTLAGAVSSVPDEHGFERVGVYDWRGDRVAGILYGITSEEVRP